MKQVYKPIATSDSAVMAFQNRSDWRVIKDALGRASLATWKPLEVVVARNSPKHFIFMTGLLVCDSDVWNLLSNAIAGNVEGLPIYDSKHTYYILNATSVLTDAVDILNSTVMASPSTGEVLCVFAYCFNEEVVNGRFLFNVKENREDMFCSSEFKSIVEENKLSNLRFVPVPMRRKLIGRQ